MTTPNLMGLTATLSITTGDFECPNAECCCPEYCYAECYDVDCDYATRYVLTVVLSVVLQGVIMLSVVAARCTCLDYLKRCHTYRAKEKQESQDKYSQDHYIRFIMTNFASVTRLGNVFPFGLHL